VIASNTALFNEMWDLSDVNPTCDTNAWTRNFFFKASRPCIH
jgi:hypothetical protein